MGIRLEIPAVILLMSIFSGPGKVDDWRKVLFLGLFWYAARWLSILLVTLQIPFLAFAQQPLRVIQRIRVANNRPMTNADIMAFVSAGFSDSLVVEKVRSPSSTASDTSVESLKVLKAAHVSDEVIDAMLESSSGAAGYSVSDDPTLMHQPGVYVQVAGRDGKAHLLPGGEQPGPAERKTKRFRSIFRRTSKRVRSSLLWRLFRL